MSIVETITTAFTAPGAYVLLVAADSVSDAVETAGTDGSTANIEASFAAAQQAVRALDRTVGTLSLDNRADTSARRSRPFWADLVNDSLAPARTAAESPLNSARGTASSSSGLQRSDSAERADLVLASMPAEAAETTSLDQLALLAAERLCHGGILAVYTHSDWNQGRLVDPTGPLVAAAQHADLLYLQHVVALHTPIRHGGLHAAPSSAVAAEYDRTRHRATARSLPAPHLRAHSDVVVFAQPADLSAPPGLLSSTPVTREEDQPGRGERG